MCSKTDFINEKELPLIMQLDDMPSDEFIAFFNKNKVDINKRLTRSGVIKFTGIQIDSLDTFQQVVNSISTKFFSYVDGNSPRTKLSGNVYTSTEHDQSLKITMHNELSYSVKWPNKLFLSCIKPSETGGETLLADSREILRIMNKDLVEEISVKGVTYIRNLHGGIGIGPSWQDTFETNDKKWLENYCKSSGIEFEWGKDDDLKLKQYSKGIHEHRETKERVWFNQIDQFHPIHLGKELYNEMLTIYDPDTFPTYVTFGNGEKIDDDMITEIMQTIDKVTIAPLWRKNELLIIDNELVSHGRNPYTGERKVLIAMSE